MIKRTYDTSATKDARVRFDLWTDRAPPDRPTRDLSPRIFKLVLVPFEVQDVSNERTNGKEKGKCQ